MEFLFIIFIGIAIFYFFGSDEKNSDSDMKLPAENKNLNYNVKLPTETKKFVKVIFKKGDRKRYDYFLGDNDDIKVGDFVEVWAHEKFSGEDKLKIVKVVYISKPGEVSYKATKEVVRKSNYKGW